MKPLSATPPRAAVHPHPCTIHGDTRPDDYHWLRDKQNPAALTYLEAENAYTEAVMAPTKGLQDALYEEMLARIQESDLSAPYPFGDYVYYSRTEQGKQYPIHCRKQNRPGAPEQVTLDLNELARGHSFLGLGAYAISDDGALLAYSVDVTGFRQYTLFIKDLGAGQLLQDRRERVVSVVWAADNRTLFYTVEDHAKRSYRLYRHRLGQEEDQLLYEENDELFRLYAARSRSRAFIYLTSSSSDTSETRYFRATRPDEGPGLFLERESGHRYYVQDCGDRFFIRTNRAATNFRIVSAPVESPRDWTEVVPHDAGIMREGLELFKGHCVVPERENGLQHLRIVGLESGLQRRVEFPEPAYSVHLDANYVFDTPLLRFRYQSFVTPASIFDYNMTSHERVLVKETQVLGGYNPSLYAMERQEVPTADGVRVPLTLVYRKDLARDGAAPALLYGYGSYGASMPVSFSSHRISLLDRGLVFAVAHIRGGGELGEDWRQSGKLGRKMNTFYDFIASAEFLVASGYTSPDRLAIEGGSAGGLLMGAVTNLRPDLFKAVIAHVPFMDVLNTMLDADLPLTVGEYLEWGNPNIAEEYAWMRRYCPYTNLERKDYPFILVRGSLNDSQVMYWEAAKYVAKLRALKTDQNPLLLKTDLGAGHGGPSGRYDMLREIAFDYAFLLSALGAGGASSFG